MIVGIIIVARPLIRNSFDASSAAPQVITAVLSLVLVMVASNVSLREVRLWKFPGMSGAD